VLVFLVFFGFSFLNPKRKSIGNGLIGFLNCILRSLESIGIPLSISFIPESLNYSIWNRMYMICVFKWEIVTTILCFLGLSGGKNKEISDDALTIIASMNYHWIQV